MNNHLSIKEIIDLLDGGATMTPAKMEETIRYLFANISPYMTAIDAMVKDTKFGEVDMKLTVRDGEVEKISFYQGKVWLRSRT